MPEPVSLPLLPDPARPAELLCDRHQADRTAFTVIHPDLQTTDLSYGWLQERSERAAAALVRLGVQPGDRVATLMGKSAELVVVLLGIWRLGAVHVPLFTAFAAPAIEIRLRSSGASVVVADRSWADKLAGADKFLGATVVLSGSAGAGDRGGLDLGFLLDAEQPGYPAAERALDDPIVEIFTSGTTGAPKGVPVPVKALRAFHAYLHYGLDVQEDDVFWNVADPGWAYGLYYGLLAPLYTGRRNFLLRSGFDAELCWRILKDFGITNFAAAPTVIRSMRAVRPQGIGSLSLRPSRAPENRWTRTPSPGPPSIWAPRCGTTTARRRWACALSIPGTRPRPARSGPAPWVLPCPVTPARCSGWTPMSLPRRA